MMKTLWVIATFIFGMGLAQAETAKVQSSNEQKVVLTVTDHGFEPKTVDVKPGIPVILEITRKSEMTCATEIVIPTMKINKALPLNQTVEIKIGKLKKGEIRFGCGMNMMEHGQIHVQ